MNFYDVIENRYSHRGFDASKEVEQEKLDRIFGAVNRAPTAKNCQPFKFMVIKNKEIREKICGIYQRGGVSNAPVIVVALGCKNQAYHRENGESAHIIDVTIALDHLILAATAEGLGSCWIIAFDQEKMAQALNISEDWEVVAITPLGYSAKASANTPRKPLSDIVEYH